MFIDGIVGARPNMMKMAPLARAIKTDGTFRLRLVHTGQHYDESLSDVFFRELGLPVPDINLGVGSGSQGEQTARILVAYERLLMESHPKPLGVIVLGDVNSTLACSLAAVKLGIPVAHVEAGLRSGDRTMPEEINRIVTDALSDLLFVSDPAGLLHLKREGRPPEKTWLVGNVMVDTLLRELPRAGGSEVLDHLGIEKDKYVYLTLHRPSNVDDPATLSNLMGVIGRIARNIPIVFAIHPRTAARLTDANIFFSESSQIIKVGPQGYHDNIRLIRDAKFVLTDSGGIQEESSVLGVPCLTLREATERPVTVELGTSELVGNDPLKIAGGCQRIMAGQWKQKQVIPFWDGKTAERIVGHLKSAWGTANG